VDERGAGELRSATAAGGDFERHQSGRQRAAYDALDVDTLYRAAAIRCSGGRHRVVAVFGGLSIEEAAEVLKLSVATVNRLGDGQSVAGSN
jgi:hypothetical protein